MLYFEVPTWYFTMLSPVDMCVPVPLVTLSPMEGVEEELTGFIPDHASLVEVHVLASDGLLMTQSLPTPAITGIMAIITGSTKHTSIKQKFIETKVASFSFVGGPDCLIGL